MSAQQALLRAIHARLLAEPSLASLLAGAASATRSRRDHVFPRWSMERSTAAIMRPPPNRARSMS